MNGVERSNDGVVLRKCPFCGRNAELRHDEEGFSFVVCANDGCYVRTDGHLNHESAIKAWNTRKPLERVIKHLEEENKLADEEKERCARNNPLQFDRAVGYSNGIFNAVEFIKGEVE